MIGKFKLLGMKIEITQDDMDTLEPQLGSWNSLNSFLIEDTSEEVLNKLMIIEKSTKQRGDIMRRIHSRLLSVRRKRERKELKIP